jgi:hypothetical protein
MVTQKNSFRWKTAPPTDLEATIAEFKSKLPGWWYSVCECQVSCDASCAPTVESPHIHYIENPRDPFDSGFHADLPQPSSLAAALRDVMEQALAAIAEYEHGS